MMADLALAPLSPAAGVPAKAGAHVYVDAAIGSDANDGTTPIAPVATLGAAAARAATVGDGARIALAAGSTWREALDLRPLVQVTVEAYGDTATHGLPVIRGDQELTGPWQSAADRGDTHSHVYSVEWTWQSGETEPSGDNFWHMFWEHQAGTDDPLDPGVMPLAYAADLTACQSTPGTFHCVNGDKEFSPVGQSRTITVHVHPHGSTDPRSDSKTYCGTARHHCVRVGDRGTVRQVHALRAGNHTGSLCGGFRCLFERCLAYDGVSHEMLMASGEFRDCIAYRGFEDPRRSVIMMEFYTADGRGEACQYTRCVCFVSPDLTGIGTGFGGHTSDNVNKPYASWSHVDCCVRGVAFAANAGQRYHFLRCVAENGWWSVASSGPNAAADLTMSDCAIHWDEATSPRSAPDGIIEIPQAASSTIIDGLRAFATGDLIGSLANVIYVPYANTVSLSRCVISLGPVVSNTFCVAINSLGADVSITESILDASEDAGGTTRLLKYRPEAVPGGGNNVYFPGHADITIVGDVNTDGSGKAAAETGSVTSDPMIADATLGDFSLGGMGLPLNAGLERPHISFTTVPADLAAAEARLR